jgi:nitrogen regulatory protein P-II 2
MKLITAYVRTRKVDDVVRALERAGAPGITVARVHGVGYGYEPSLFTLAPREVPKTPEVSQVEVACSDEHVEGLIQALLAAARTGDPGDGIAFVSPLERVARVRTGEQGEAVLRSPHHAGGSSPATAPIDERSAE